MMMNTTKVCLSVTGVVLWSGLAFAQQPQKADVGKQEYETKCAVCHGAGGKGDGPMAGQLRTRPSDLTVLARKNQGVVPVARMFEVIEGANIPAHGTREMPVWGREFRIEDAQYYKEARGSYDPAVLVRARILALIDYISRIQAR
ncbi:c-type cytochrome [Noviherbaspirillum agri]